MTVALVLRPGTLRDADLLLAWRNDPATRKASCNTAEVGRDEHRAWLTAALSDGSCRLFIGEENGLPVGSVRADLAEGAWELSWTVAPNARGRGIGKQLGAMIASCIAEPVCAEVKADNIASAKIAEYAGLALAHEADGILYYRRGRIGP